MNDLALDAEPGFVADLRALVASPRAAEYVCISARREHGVRSGRIDRPMLAVVLRGRKQLRGQGGALSLGLSAGDVFAVVRPCSFDAVNRPDAQGVYLTLALPLCDEVIAAARLLWARPAATGGPDVVALPAHRLDEPFGAWARAMRRDEYGLARAALAGLLVHLCAMGHSAILAPAPPSLSARIRARVAEAPERDWRSTDFEADFGLSGATLRRHLAVEGGSLREVVTEARLACALQLLYTTRWPVKTVAARVGYRSAATFSRRFAHRYGLEPTQIGNG